MADPRSDLARYGRHAEGCQIQYCASCGWTQGVHPIPPSKGSIVHEFDSMPCSCGFAEALAREGWQPIETAPKDGTEVLLRVKLRAGIPGCCLVGHHMKGGHCIEDHPAINRGWYFWNGCMFDVAADPTHWRPLPAPPLPPGVSDVPHTE